MAKKSKTPRKARLVVTRPKAKIAFASRLDPTREAGGILRWGRPEINEHDLASTVVWRTLCNRYMIARVVSTYNHADSRFVAYSCEPVEAAFTRRITWIDTSLQYDHRTSRPRAYRTLYRAIEAVNENLQEMIGNNTIKSNDNAMMDHAAELGFDELPAKTKPTTPRPKAATLQEILAMAKETPDTITINASDVAAMFIELKFPAAPSYELKKLQGKVNHLPEAGEEEALSDMLSSKSAKKLFKDVMDAARMKKEIEVVEDRDDFLGKGKKKGKDKPVAEPVAKTDKKAKKGAKEKPAKPAKEKPAKAKVAKKEKTEVKRDKFGTKVGTTAAAWNAALTNKPQSMGELMKKAGINCTRYPHAEKMIAAGHVKKDKEGKFLLKK